MVQPGYEAKPWKPAEVILFRFFFLFFLLLILPIDWKFYREVWAINWAHLHFHDLFRLSKYQTQFIAQDKLPAYGIGVFTNWGIAILVAAAGTALWTKLDKTKKEYNVLYYWLRVVLRYKLAIVLITYGFIKLFPLQMPYPSLSDLQTNYGDYFPWKIYFQTTGIAPKYQSFLGFVEILAAFLLFNRKTVTFGVGLIFGFIGNVAVVNGFYDVGELITSTFIVLVASFLFIYDIPRLWHFLVQELPTKANKLVPRFSDKKLKAVRTTGRVAFLLFILLFGYKTFDNYTHDPYKVPKTAGLRDSYGFYNVKEFVLNHDTIPYSNTDPNRWQDVIFEKWSTLTIKVNRPVKIDFSSGEKVAEKDIDRNYELAGLAGRHYFYYDADTVNHTLALQNKNIHHRNEKLSLQYAFPNDSTIILNGINENSDSIHVVLNRINKKYMMFEGRRRPVKI
ncbi:DoxX family protein [Paraflavitalea soli]|uniref:DoxX family protein n=1 Tax=Paraflavitalea soli TaxID=2315862 RepID=A0A3B7MWH7_9BACT|nr:DoxX family protein [Paraflavitalea soli]